MTVHASRVRFVWTVIAVAVVTGCSTSSSTAPPDAHQVPGRDVDPRADALLRAMSDTLAAAGNLSFRASVVEETIDPERGNVVHVLSRRTISMARPSRLRVDEDDIFARHQAWYAGGRLTVFGSLDDRYAEAEVPATIDAMLDHLYDEYGLVMPIADLMLSDPYAALSAAIETGTYLGESTVSGSACHQLAFRQEHLDWQLWIEEQGSRVLPRKLVITYTAEPGQPQFVAELSGWDLDSEFEGGHFEARLPSGAERVDLATLVEAGS